LKISKEESEAVHLKTDKQCEKDKGQTDKQ
jgi:hypothetical protein